MRNILCRVFNLHSEWCILSVSLNCKKKKKKKKLRSLTVYHLKCELQKRGLKVSGNTDELIICLADVLNSEGENLEVFERKCITSYEMNEEECLAGAKPKSSDISLSYDKNREGHDKSGFEDEKRENVDPEDNISNVSHRSCSHSSESGTSSARNARALEQARLAGLKAKASKLREIQLLGQQKLKLQ